MPTTRPYDLQGTIALVTGASRGIGESIARTLAAHGARVVVSSRKADGCERVAASIEAAGGKAEARPCHIGEVEQIKAIMERIEAEHGRLDILVNNAGVTMDRPIQKMTVDDWHKVLRVNLSGAFYMSKPTIDHMLERGSGRIINISSVIGEVGNIGQLNYASSKSGLFGFTKTLAREAYFSLAKGGKLDEESIGVTVNAVTPGLIATEMTAGMPEKMLEALRNAIPARRMGRPEEIARVVCFLAADASSYITGQVWGVNGGYDM
jgi:acetoacetyl-CoA reductase/3-oxoacyl-[acyl-carrier protein] reductase